MNCEQARKVWGHPDGFISGIRATFPGVMERLTGLVTGLLEDRTNPFHARVAEKAGSVERRFYVEHGDDDDPLTGQIHDVIGDEVTRLKLQEYFLGQFEVEIVLGNICCSGCKASLGQPSLAEAEAIQSAAIRTAADGSDLVI